MLIRDITLYCILVLYATHSTVASASPNSSKQSQVELSACFEQAAQRYGVDRELLESIAQVESNFNQYATNKNKSGSVDMGVMQINSTHLTYLSKYNITQQTLYRDGCININVGAWVLANAIKKHGYTWRAIGAYNAGSAKSNERARQIYANKVYFALASRKYKSAPSKPANQTLPIIQKAPVIAEVVDAN